MTIRVQAEDFDPGDELARLMGEDDASGAVVSFLGLCRGRSGDRTVTSMVLEHYPGMTEQALVDIEATAVRRWALDRCLIIHRYGRLIPGDRIVFVAVASPHRADAFDACRFLMDWLKTKAPFWKCEETPEGPVWVEARAEDDAAAARWDAV